MHSVNQVNAQLVTFKIDLLESAPYTLDQVLDKGDELLDSYQYDVAQKFIHRALEMNPDSVRALQMAATILLEAGDVESAKHCLGRAVAVEPETGHGKYFSLAQIFGGREALQLYQKGIEIAARTRDATKEEEKLREISRELSNGLCSVAELYMTDLCDEEEAERECEAAVFKATEADNANPEAWQTKARLCIVREQFEVSEHLKFYSIAPDCMFKRDCFRMRKNLRAEACLCGCPNSRPCARTSPAPLPPPLSTPSRSARCSTQLASPRPKC